MTRPALARRVSGPDRPTSRLRRRVRGRIFWHAHKTAQLVANAFGQSHGRARANADGCATTMPVGTVTNTIGSPVAA
jgi:hypothetical protein